MFPIFRAKKDTPTDLNEVYKEDNASCLAGHTPVDLTIGQGEPGHTFLC